MAITETKLMILQVRKERTNKGLGLDLSHIVAEQGLGPRAPNLAQAFSPPPGVLEVELTGGGKHVPHFTGALFTQIENSAVLEAGVRTDSEAWCGHLLPLRDLGK